MKDRATVTWGSNRNRELGINLAVTFPNDADILQGVFSYLGGRLWTNVDKCGFCFLNRCIAFQRASTVMPNMGATSFGVFVLRRTVILR